MRSKRTVLVVLLAWIVVLFAAGVVWRVVHPEARQQSSPAAKLASRQDGYYLCLHRPRLAEAQMRLLIARRLPHDVAAAALRGCREGQHR